MIAAVLHWKPRIFRLQLQFLSRCYVGTNCCNATLHLYMNLFVQNTICNDFVSNGILAPFVLNAPKSQRFLRFAIADAHRRPQKSLAISETFHCDFRVRWKVASDLRFWVAISEAETPFFLWDFRRFGSVNAEIGSDCDCAILVRWAFVGEGRESGCF